MPMAYAIVLVLILTLLQESYETLKMVQHLEMRLTLLSLASTVDGEIYKEYGNLTVQHVGTKRLQGIQMA